MIFKKSSGIVWLVVFLGNPGPKYECTRHNAGFMTADAVEKKFGISIKRSRFKSLTAEYPIGGEKVLFMKPQTYMNLSGEAVRQAADFYKIPSSNIIVVSDETALPIGKIRIKKSGSAGGHNGLKNIISCLGTEDFPRIRLGVGAAPSKDYDMKDWVLSVFRNQDLEEMLISSSKAADAVESYILNGADKTMNLYN